ncbi:MAG: tyrosine-type recombinase/integrase [Pseudomonadota bacterium]
MKNDTRPRPAKPHSDAVSTPSLESGYVPATDTRSVPGKPKTALTDTQCRNAKPKAKPYKLTDPASRGLYLWITPNGSKTWRRRVSVDGKETTATLGNYPDMSLTDARRAAADVRAMAKEGVNPSLAKKAEEQAKRAERSNTFEAVAREFIDHRRPHVAPETAEDMETRFTGYLFPKIGTLPIADIDAPTLLHHLQAIAKQSAHMAKKQRADASRVFRYAMVTGRCTADPAAAVDGMLPKTRVEHRARLRIEDMGGFFKRLKAGSIGASTQNALRLLILTAVRPGEVAGARWEEFDFERNEWAIPAERTKKRRAHIVPLSTHALDLLDQQRLLSGRLEHVFPNARQPRKPLWPETLLQALRRLDYTGEEATAHGFRGTFSTTMHEHGWRSDVIEMQLAHVDRDTTRRSYNAAQHLPERRKLLQAWGDMLATLERDEALKVIPMRRVQA